MSRRTCHWNRTQASHLLVGIHLHLHLGFVHPLQDVALHQCLPSSSVCCFPNPGGSLLLCYVLVGIMIVFLLFFFLTSVSFVLSVCLSSLVCVVGVIYVYVDIVFGFCVGFLLLLFCLFFYYVMCLVGCFSTIFWTPAVLSVL